MTSSDSTRPRLESRFSRMRFGVDFKIGQERLKHGERLSGRK